MLVLNRVHDAGGGWIESDPVGRPVMIGSRADSVPLQSLADVQPRSSAVLTSADPLGADKHPSIPVDDELRLLAEAPTEWLGVDTRPRVAAIL